MAYSCAVFGREIDRRIQTHVASALRARRSSTLRLVLTQTLLHTAKTERRYPDALEQLVPGVLPDVPLDIYSGKSLFYKKVGEGFCLYSVFKNTIDDGGTAFDRSIVNGQRVSTKNAVGQMKSDLVILLPLPDFDFKTSVE